MVKLKSKNKQTLKTLKEVAIIMGSYSDLKVMKESQKALKLFSIGSEIKIVSAHRTPEGMFSFAKEARDKGFKIIIAGAGGAAHLPGMVASLTTLPVIGVPVTQGTLKGLDAILSICQMPKGVPVATVAVDNAFNAGLLAARILGASDLKISSQLETFSRAQKTKVKAMNAKLKALKK